MSAGRSILLVCATGIIGCDLEKPPPPVVRDAPGHIHMSAAVVERFGAEGAQVRVAMERAQLSRQSKNLEADEVVIEVPGPGPTRETSWWLRAPYGRADLATGVYHLFGGVRMTTGMRLVSTASVTYDARAGVVTAPGRVRMRDGGLWVQGVGMRVDLEARQMWMHGPVRTEPR